MEEEEDEEEDCKVEAYSSQLNCLGAQVEIKSRNKFIPCLGFELRTSRLTVQAGMSSTITTGSLRNSAMQYSDYWK